ncbi:hypothetical protein TL16_g08915 [Triparma laevis f. inornata]|uniref:Uncharacterized protein n=1 Tax=Triparma laevis f. inornata TaxID=1714386 RepID=A0A9W7B4K1_9STRA|nr:hypothetical protein TL16_g08915 [Triparma laevis f. inornata]
MPSPLSSTAPAAPPAEEAPATTTTTTNPSPVDPPVVNPPAPVPPTTESTSSDIQPTVNPTPTTTTTESSPSDPPPQVTDVKADPTPTSDSIVKPNPDPVKPNSSPNSKTLPLSTTTTVTTTISTTIKTSVDPTEALPPPSSTPSTSPPKITIRHTGTLYISPSKRQHILTGTWTQLSSPSTNGPFTWKYTLPGDKNLMVLPQRKCDFKGLFKLLSDGKKRKGVEVVENVEKMLFSEVEGEEGEWRIEGKGVNKYGAFLLDGRGKVEKGGEGEMAEMKVTIDKTYYVRDPNELPDVSDSHDVQVCCLRGEMNVSQDTDNFAIITINGKWSSDRLNLLVDPNSLTPDQIVSPFQLIHKSGTPFSRHVYPPEKQVRLAGWFEFWNLGTQSTTKVGENDISFKLVGNKEGGWNVEGRGRNQYGTFFLTGTLDKDRKSIELYKHFPPRPVASKKPDRPRNANLSPPKLPALPLTEPVILLPCTLEEIELEPNSETCKEPIDEATGARLYECYMRGNLTFDPQGCTTKVEGEWCAMKSIFDDPKSRSKFRLGLENTTEMCGGSDKWTGWFGMRQKSGSSKKVMEKQIALKFSPNNSSTGHNVAGCGINDFGRFKIIGSFFPLSSTAGKIELYKWYTQMASPVPIPRKPKVERKKVISPKPKVKSESVGMGMGGGRRA